MLDTSSLSAFSWADRHIFVTRGLVEHTDDDELAAAIAHELGHLVDGHHVHRSAVGLRGCDPSLIDTEARADELGAQLLESQGLPRRALTRLLAKVRAACPPGDDRAALGRRIEWLEHATHGSSIPGKGSKRD